MGADLIARYAELLAEDADLLGLTAKRGAAVQELIEDALTGLRWLPDGARVLDLGSGGGVPGIPLQCVRPDCRFTLVEANQRKAGFLEKACAELGLPAAVVARRSEELAGLKEHRGRYDCVTAKAVAALPVLIELALPFLKVGGILLAYKGPAVHEELAAAAKALHELKGKVLPLEPYALGERTYYHCRVEKVGETPRRYPRRAGIPAHQPL